MLFKYCKHERILSTKKDNISIYLLPYDLIKFVKGTPIRPLFQDDTINQCGFKYLDIQIFLLWEVMPTIKNEN